jgi:probable phosphoglycerate mutase
MALSVPDGITLYFARHGQTEANVEKRYQGHTVDTPLTAKGVAQAEDLAAILRAKTPFDTLDYVSSPLNRAQVTMQILLVELGRPIDGFRTDERLSEINLGDFDGLTDAEAKQRFPKEYAARQADKWNVKVPGGGENYAAVAQRVSAFIADLRRDTFAVSHGAATRILRGLFQELSWQQMSALDEPQGCVFRVRGNLVERLDLS